MHFTEYHTRVAAYALLVRGDEVLLTYYNGTTGREPCWTLPGGGVEVHEQCEEAAVREVLEETGHSIDLGRPLTTSSVVRRQPDGSTFKAVRVVYEATITGGELGVQEVDGTTSDARWFAVDQARSVEPRADVVDAALTAWSALRP